MAAIVVLDPLVERQTEIDFADLVTLIKGTAITSLASSKDFLELGLSERFNLRIQPDGTGGVNVILMSTLNADEVPPLTVKIIDEGESATAELVQRRIAALRQAYAIAYLINTGRGDELGSVLGSGWEDDVEGKFLRNEEKLYIEAAGPGSLWLTIIAKTKVGYQTATDILALFYSEGRDALLRRVRANTVIKELEADHKRLRLDLDRANGVLDMANKIEKLKDPKVRAAAKTALIRNLQAIGPEARNLLPPPSNDANPPKSA